MCKMIKRAMLIAMILCNIALLHAAADDKKVVLAHLTSKVEQTYLGKKITYFSNDTLVGHICYGASILRDKFGWIDTLKIEKEFRFQGFGSYILMQAMRDLKYDGYNEVRLEAEPLEATVKEYAPALSKLVQFYEKNGFRVLHLNILRAVMHASL